MQEKEVKRLIASGSDNILKIKLKTEFQILLKVLLKESKLTTTVHRCSTTCNTLPSIPVFTIYRPLFFTTAHTRWSNAVKRCIIIWSALSISASVMCVRLSCWSMCFCEHVNSIETYHAIAWWCHPAFLKRMDVELVRDPYTPRVNSIRDLPFSAHATSCAALSYCSRAIPSISSAGEPSALHHRPIQLLLHTHITLESTFHCSLRLLATLLQH